MAVYGQQASARYELPWEEFQSLLLGRSLALCSGWTAPAPAASVQCWTNWIKGCECGIIDEDILIWIWLIGLQNHSLISLRGSGSTPASPHDRFFRQKQLAASRSPIELRAALRALSRLTKVDPIIHLVQNFLYQRIRHLKVEQVLKQAIIIEQLCNCVHLTTSLRESLKAGFSGKAGFSTPIWWSDLIW